MWSAQQQNWSTNFSFFLKVKKDVKSKLTLHASGDAGGEGPRTHIQGKRNHLYLLNSIVKC